MRKRISGLGGSSMAGSRGASTSALPPLARPGRILPGGAAGKEIDRLLRERYRFVASDREGLGALRAILSGEPEVHLYFLSRLEKRVFGPGRDGTILLLQDGEGKVRGGLFLGKGRNLAVSRLPREALPLLPRVVLAKARGVQVAVSPKEEIDALAAGLASRVEPLLHRVQVLYLVRRGWELGPQAGDLRAADEEDLPWLAEAGFNLAREDLGIPPWALSKTHLRRVAARRLRKGKTFVIRRAGKPVFKVDLAVRAGEGVLVEGVFTDPEFRGRGLASRGVAALCGRILEEYPLAALHVGAENLPARRAYEKAGMRPAGELGLLLYLPW